jgi:hypothetical protein
VDDGLQGQLYLSLPSRLAAFVSGRLHIEAAEVQPDPLWKLAIEAPVSQQETQLQAEKSTDVNKFSLERLLSDPDVYLHQTVQIETLAGRQIRGQFQGLNEGGELLIRQMVKAPGFVVFQVAPAEIGQIRLES